MDNGHLMEDRLLFADQKLEVNAVLFDLDGTLIDSLISYLKDSGCRLFPGIPCKRPWTTAILTGTMFFRTL